MPLPTITTSMPAVLTIGFALVVALLGALLRRRLPAGVGEGALVTAVSGGALLGLAYSRNDSWRPEMAGHVLAGLAIVWYALGRVSARRPVGPDGRVLTTPETSGNLDRATVFGQAGLVCALGVVVWCCAAPGGLGSSAGWSPAASDYVALLVLALLVWAFRSGKWASYPALALLGWLVVENVPAAAVDRSVRILLPIAVLLVVSVVGALLLQWRRSTRHWPVEPPPQPEEQRPGAGLVVAVTVVAVGVGLLSLRAWDQRAAGPTLLLAALAVLVVAHWSGRERLGELGLTLVGAGIVTACTGWLTAPAWLRFAIGGGLASWYLLWLARFWHQQLDDGRAWTTAGRLIPAARQLAWAAAAVALVGCGMRVAVPDGDAPLWAAVFATVVLLAAMSQHARDQVGGAGAALAACLATAAASEPLVAVLAASSRVEAGVITGWTAASTLLALRLAVSGVGGESQAAVFRAYFGGVLPVGLLMTVSMRGFDSATMASCVLAFAALLVGLHATRFEPAPCPQS